jgi:DNA polymerase-3 subunit delta'
MKFEAVVGQHLLKQKLIPMIADERLPHAILLAGHEGVGTLPIALAIAQMACCERVRPKKADDGGLFGATPPSSSPASATDSCGECGSCQKAQKLIHPDIHFTYPVYTKKTGSKALSADFIQEWRTALAANPYLNLNDWLQHIAAENKQGNISSAECREIIQSVSLKSFESEYKVYIIWMAEQLKETGNILLKVIEEPPPNTLFIFVVEQIELVIGTILSRTQIFKLPPILPNELADFLTQKENLEPDHALKVAKIADGNLNLALQFSRLATNQYETALQRWFSTSVRLFGAAASDASIALQDIADDFQKLGRENQKAFLQYCVWTLREMNLLSQGIESEKLTPSELTFASKVATLITPDAARKLLTLFENLMYHIERNANPKINFYAVSFSMGRIFTKK